ncbi:MAG: hypothetical protein ACI9F9_003024, partial [Candidatus Paceibacteria bacterium]
VAGHDGAAVVRLVDHAHHVNECAARDALLNQGLGRRGSVLHGRIGLGECWPPTMGKQMIEVGLGRLFESAPKHIIWRQYLWGNL